MSFLCKGCEFWRLSEVRIRRLGYSAAAHSKSPTAGLPRSIIVELFGKETDTEQ